MEGGAAWGWSTWGVGQSWGWGSLGVEVVGVGFWQYSPIDVCVFLLANIFWGLVDHFKKILKVGSGRSEEVGN